MIYRVGNFEIHPNTRTIYDQDRQLHVQPKPFDIILYLIENRERMVSKDELISAIWGDVNLSETALTRSVMKARRVLADDANTQSVIKTVHGYGYQFIGDVQSIDASESNIGAVAAAPETKRLNRPLRVLATLCAVIMLATFSFFFLNTGTSNEGVRIAVLPVQNETGNADLDWAELGLMSVVNNTIRQSDDLHRDATYG